MPFDPVDAPPYYAVDETDEQHGDLWLKVGELDDRLTALEGGDVTPPDPNPGPDAGVNLTVEELLLEPGAPKQYEPVKITVTVTNGGTDATPAGVGVGVGLFVDDEQVSWVAPSTPLEGGQSVTLDTATAPSTGGAWTPSSAGAVTVRAVADDMELIDETAEGDNTTSVAVTVAAGTAPPPSTKPYTSSSSWNTKLPSGTNYRDEPGLTQGGVYLNRDAYSGPVVESVPSDPLVTMDVGPSWGWPAQRLQFHCPTGQSGASGTDGSLVVIDGDLVLDFWQFHRSGPNSATCNSWAKSNRRTESGWPANPPHSFPSAGIHAAGSALLAGLIRGNELTDPAGIGHTLAVGIRRNLAHHTFVGEAIYSDGSSGPIPEGTRIAIPRGTAKPGGLNQQVSNLWDCLVEYGAFVIDVADGVQSTYLWADPNSVPAGDASAANTNNGALGSALRIVT